MQLAETGKKYSRSDYRRRLLRSEELLLRQLVPKAPTKAGGFERRMRDSILVSGRCLARSRTIHRTSRVGVNDPRRARMSVLPQYRKFFIWWSDQPGVIRSCWVQTRMAQPVHIWFSHGGTEDTVYCGAIVLFSVNSVPL